MLRLSASLFLAASLTACATVKAEDEPRRVSMNWNIAPETEGFARKSVEAGDIITSWTAEALATHQVDYQGRTVTLVSARTRLGSIYCGGQQCFEDRDGDGAFELVWTLVRNSTIGAFPQYVEKPVPLMQPTRFRAAADSSVVFRQYLGLVFTGPLQGVPKADNTLQPMIGELSLGWIADKLAARTPSGAGWLVQDVMPLVVAEGFSARTSVTPLNLSYRPLKVTVEGEIEIEVETKPAKDIDLDAKHKLEVEDGAKKADKPAIPEA